MSSVSLFLWFDGQAEEAARFYTSVVPNSRLLDTALYPPGLPLPEGSVLSVRFMLDGVEFVALNGGPEFRFTPAISIAILCDTQADVDRLWDALTDGGEESQCGWLIDRFGVSWQVIPRGLNEMLTAPDHEAARRATEAMLSMRKIDIAAMRRAFEGA